MDKMVVFHPLRQEQLEQILEIELARVQQRVMDAASRRFRFSVTPAAGEFLLREGTNLKYGARHLKRAIERYVVNPLARLVATDQVNTGDMLLIDRHPGDKGLAFLRERNNPRVLQRCCSLLRIRVSFPARKLDFDALRFIKLDSNGGR